MLLWLLLIHGFKIQIHERRSLKLLCLLILLCLLCLELVLIELVRENLLLELIGISSHLCCLLLLLVLLLLLLKELLLLLLLLLLIEHIRCLLDEILSNQQIGVVVYLIEVLSTWYLCTVKLDYYYSK